MYINFCDPWPSKKHAKRRLTYEKFLLSYREFLRDGGGIEFKTDNRPLFDFSLTQFTRAGYRLSEVTNDLHREQTGVIQTDYEAGLWLKVKINRCVATKEAAVPSRVASPQALPAGLPARGDGPHSLRHGGGLCPEPDPPGPGAGGGPAVKDVEAMGNQNGDTGGPGRP